MNSTNHTKPRYSAEKRRRGLFCLIAALILADAGSVPAEDLPAYRVANATPPAVAREFRGAWIATVYNLDWPSKAGLPAATQQAELRRILDRAAALRLNAILLQVRPSCDALYCSTLEPWSAYLSGAMGRPPDPFYDPLEFAITEAHRRGLELHAWFNPFRALPNAKQPASSRHVSRQHPDWIVRYGNYLWLDPANSEARDLVISVIQDVVRRYDVDGIHLDDYFYPYPDKARHEFSDEATWSRYKADGGKLDRADWRRQNINTFIERLYSEIKQVRPAVKFGISPFGIWRPGVPKSIEAQLDAYADLYADSRLWLREGWLDYFSPQLYWSVRPAKQSFPVLLTWWASENIRRRHLWPGIATERIGPNRPAQEIVDQIRLTRDSRDASGQIHWSMKALMNNQGGIATQLAETVYAEPALVPASPWLSPTPPASPALSVKMVANGALFSWESGRQSEAVSLWVIQWKAGDNWTTKILSSDRAAVTVPDTHLSIFAVTPVSRTGITGQSAALERMSPRKPMVPFR